MIVQAQEALPRTGSPGMTRWPRPSSGRYAAALAGSYALLAGAYILVSSSLAAGASTSVEDMERIETIKGIVYVIVTAALVYVGALWTMRRLERDAQHLHEREVAMLAAESRVLAGLMASSVAHDANNLLVTVLAEVDELAREAAPEQRASATRLLSSLHRLIGLNQRLVRASNAEVARERQPVDLVLAARQCVEELRHSPDLRRRSVEVLGAGEFVVMASPPLIHQMLSNLVLNAGHAAGERGVVQIRVDAADEQFVVEVHDSGPGIPLERRANLFGALTTTKANGNGLGLFSVRACVESLSGSVEVDESPLGGALFRVTLPSRQAVASVGT